jgi:hypothetical protein
VGDPGFTTAIERPGIDNDLAANLKRVNSPDAGDHQANV